MTSPENCCNGLGNVALTNIEWQAGTENDGEKGESGNKSGEDGQGTLTVMRGLTGEKWGVKNWEDTVRFCALLGRKCVPKGKKSVPNCAELSQTIVLAVTIIPSRHELCGSRPWTVRPFNLTAPVIHSDRNSLRPSIPSQT